MGPRASLQTSAHAALWTAPAPLRSCYLHEAAVDIPVAVLEPAHMPRIVILGNAAGGKSTLARRLSQERRLPHIEIDRLYWQADWSLTPAQVYERRHSEMIAGNEWIIDGGGDLPSVRARAERATEIILIDMPLWVHFWLAAERQISWAEGKIEHPPGGIAEMPPTRRLFEIMWQVDRDWMPILRALCHEKEAEGKRVIRLTSIDELNAFAPGS